MKNRKDFLFKTIVTAAILVSLAFLVIPALPKKAAPAENRSAAPPSGGAPERGGAGREQKIPSQAVESYVTSLETVSNYIKVNGDILTEGEIEIFPDISGKLTDISVSVGDKVAAGQPIASVDPSLPGQNYSRSTVYATIGGTVLRYNAHRGDKVTTGTSILTLGDLTRLKLVTYIPEKFAAYIKKGLPAEITFAAFGDRLYGGEISDVGTVIDPASRTLEITIKLNEMEDVKPGMFASIKLVTEQVRNVVAVPEEALFSYYGNDTVFVINSEGKAERREVAVGLRSSELVELKEGVSPGESVITAGQSLLDEGTPVHAITRDTK